MLQRLNPGARHILMTTDAVGGVWNYALELAREFQRCGDTVTLAGLGPAPSSEQRDAAKAVAQLLWLETPPDWLAEDGSELDDFPAEIAPVLKDQAVDIVHINAPSLAAGLELGCPLVVVSHSCVTTWFDAVRGSAPDCACAWHTPRNRQGFDRADAVVAPSASHAASLLRCYGPIAGLQVIHNGVTDAGGGGESRDMVFAAARWWDEGKNAALLDAAAAGSEWPLFAAGPTSGPNGQHVSFRHAVSLGPLPNGEVLRLMARADIFVSPSLYEPFGLAALEAAAAGAALLLADIPTYRELWTGAAVFFSPHDAGELTAGLYRLVENDAERRKLAAAAQRRARRFTIASQAKEMRQVYDQSMAHAARF